jgi:hypothetical protein
MKGTESTERASNRPVVEAFNHGGERIEYVVLDMAPCRSLAVSLDLGEGDEGVGARVDPFLDAACE